MESFGSYLKEEREQRGINIEEISRITKIGSGQLRSLESDDFAALPPIAFVKGFVRAYARHIGINPDNAIIRLEQYLSEIEEEDSFGELAPQQFRPASPDSKLLLVAAAVFFGVIVLVIIFAVKSCGDAENALRPVSPSSHRMRALSEPIAEPLPIVSPIGEIADPALPTVPPRSFRIYEVAPPPVYPTGDEKVDNSDELSGSGPRSMPHNSP